MEIVVPYQVDFANVVASFMEAAGTSYGADGSEQMRLRLLGEEAFSFIMGGIPDQDFSEMFHLRCMETDDGLIWQFSNHGRPMDVREIRDFSIDDADATADGLSLRLLRSFSEELDFRNLGRNGWELVIRSKIRNFTRLSEVTREPAPNNRTETESEYLVKRSTRDDVPGIINLVYNTYRYSYAKSFAYSPEKLSEAIEKGNIASLIAVTPTGKIIGHNAVLFESSELGEVGMAMVDPEYRRSRAFIQLVRTTREAVVEQYPAMVLYIKAVTSHKSSQAFMTGFTPCLLELSVYQRADFVGSNGDMNPRESLIFAYATITGRMQDKPMYVPQEHYTLIKELLTAGGISIDVLICDSDTWAGETLTEVKRDEEARRASLMIDATGKDFDTALRKHTRALAQDSMATVNVIIPTAMNLPSGLDSLLAKNGYVFCGIKPNASGSWDLIYTNLLNQKFDFDKIQLFSARANELRDYIRDLYYRMV